MKYIIDKDLIEAAEKITSQNYGAIDGVIITSDAVELMIERLIDRYNEVVDKFADYVKEVDENYKRSNSDPYLEYGVSPADF